MPESVRISLGSAVVTVELGADGPRSLADVLDVAKIVLTSTQRVALNSAFIPDESLNDTEVHDGDRVAIAGNKDAG